MPMIPFTHIFFTPSIILDLDLLVEMELMEPKILLMTDGPRYVCSRCGVKYKKGLSCKKLLSKVININFVYLQCQPCDHTWESAAEALSARCVPKLLPKNETSQNTWRNTNVTDFGSTPPSTSSKMKSRFNLFDDALHLHETLFSPNRISLSPPATLLSNY